MATFEEVARQCGCRSPEVSQCEKGTYSGLRLVVTDPEAAPTVPGSGVARQPGATGDAAAPVGKNAELLGQLSAVRLGEWSGDPEAAAVAPKNAYS